MLQLKSDVLSQRIIYQPSNTIEETTLLQVEVFADRFWSISESGVETHRITGQNLERGLPVARTDSTAGTFGPCIIIKIILKYYPLDTDR